MNFLFKKERPRITQTIQEVPKVSILSEVKEEVKEEEKGLAYSEEEEEEMKKNLKDLGYL